LDLPFEKMQAVGNDFVLVEAEYCPEADFSRLATEICERHYGVGADGLLALLEPSPGRFRMRMFNPDGTEDDCGNGMRCVARYIRTYRSAADELCIESLSGTHTIRILEHGPVSSRVRVGMGEPRFSPEAIPMRVDADRVIDYPLSVKRGERRITCLNTGSTHTVIFLDGPVDPDTFAAESPLIEHHPLFPDRTSVIWTSESGPNQLKIRIWERGAGETLGCGTGACAAAVAAQIRGLAAGPTAVTSPGGTLHIEWQSGGEIWMTGPASTVFTGVWRSRSR
jgi:diaminopimelate epimerase